MTPYGNAVSCVHSVTAPADVTYDDENIAAAARGGWTISDVLDEEHKGDCLVNEADGTIGQASEPPVRELPLAGQAQAHKTPAVGNGRPDFFPASSNDAFLPSRHKLLVTLKTRGPQTVADLGAILGVTRAAIRHQLTKLAVEGLTTATSASHGVGRPALFWSLTHEGNARFPDAHAKLTLQLIGMIRMQLGDSAADQLIEDQTAESLSGYMEAMKNASKLHMEDASELQKKVACLAEVRSREGYMAEWHAQGDEFVLIENHCPIATAAKACQGLCKAEIETFRKVLGEGVSVERTEQISSGDRRCTFHIRNKT